MIDFKAKAEEMCKMQDVDPLMEIKGGSAPGIILDTTAIALLSEELRQVDMAIRVLYGGRPVVNKESD